MNRAVPARAHGTSGPAGRPPPSVLPATRPSALLRIAPLVVLLIVDAGTLRAAPPGRLFFTPGERAAIERRLTAEQTEPPAGESLYLQGEVRHRSGARTVWLNGQARHEPPPARKREAHSPASGSSAEGLAGPPDRVKIGNMTASVGTTLLPERSQVLDPFAGHLVVHRGKSRPADGQAARP